MISPDKSASASAKPDCPTRSSDLLRPGSALLASISRVGKPDNAADTARLAATCAVWGVAWEDDKSTTRPRPWGWSSTLGMLRVALR